MNTLDILFLIVTRALEVSLTLATPVSVLFYVIFLGCITWAHHHRPKLGSFVQAMGMIFFFFVIWNHPGYSWYKRNPWNGGYVYAAIMIIVYIYLPMKLTSIGIRLFKKYQSGAPGESDSGKP